MKPWSEASQEGLKLLLRFYKERNFELSYCPLCQSVGYSSSIGANACRKCPWVIMTSSVCFCLGRTSLVILPEVIRMRVNCSLEDYKLDKEDLKAIDKRIKQLEEWIEYYEKYEEGL